MEKILSRLSISELNPCIITGLTSKYSDVIKTIKSPIDNGVIASVCMSSVKQYDDVVKTSEKAFEFWRAVPAPKRGEIIRQIGNELRKNKEALGILVSIETGKILQEGVGEVQEMIDICDFAVGLSRQLYGLSLHSERPEHRMYEQWHPLGIVGVITAFNFPVAVWAWNVMLAAVCGNVSIWKPSEKTPIVAIACHNIIKDVLKRNNIPEGVFSLIIGDASIGSEMAKDNRISLISATGSTNMGRIVGKTVADRFGKTILELGGNNAVIITPSANLDLAIRAVVFGSVGTAGQRCTSTRRLIVHSSIYDVVKERLIRAYNNLRIGNPLLTETLVGPLIDENAVNIFKDAILKIKEEGGNILIGGNQINDNYVHPTIAEVENHYKIVQEENFVPILFLIKYDGEVLDAIKIQNDVKQGLSSSIFTNDIRESELFLSCIGSDCGIASVNVGTSGAEITGSFFGLKESGNSGSESGTNSWQCYMRKQTVSINYSTELPLSQGIKFDL